MNYYTIKDMETLSGIKAHTIRIWEKRYGLLSPDRSNTNIRYYSDEELRKLLNVSMLVKHGYKISKVSVLDDQTIREEVLKLNGKTADHSGILDQLVVQMVNFNEPRFEELIEKEIEESGFEETIMNVIFPLFEKIGVFWQTGSLFPAQEHFVSNLVRQRMIRESSRFDNSNSRKTVLFFLKEDEQHELSLLFYNYLALKSGYKTIYLGQNVPFDDLVHISEMNKIDYIFSAFINALGKEDLENYLIQLSQLVNKKRVFVSGRQILEHQPNLPRNFKVVSDIQSFKKYFGVLH
ncbi:MerR family transcriptional regulator [Sunxiuqinia sp. A32]|uniref:MerR family transcriptional regulator n=1 Tax=Sunxiuqinia sp. A32 TaxID=3461496 RepID=UPI004045BDFC